MSARRVVSTVLLATLTLTGVTSCSGEARPERADTVQGGGSREPAASASTTPASDTTLTADQARSALLTVADLPTGWTTDASDDETENDRNIEPQECDDVFGGDGPDAEPSADAEANFTAGGLGPVLQQQVYSYEEDTAERIETVTAALDRCPSFTSRDGDGDAVAFTATPLSFPNLGDRTAAARLTGNSAGIDVELDLICIASGRNVIILVAGGLTPLPGDDLETIGRRAVERLTAAAGA